MSPAFFLGARFLTACFVALAAGAKPPADDHEFVQNCRKSFRSGSFRSARAIAFSSRLICQNPAVWTGFFIAPSPAQIARTIATKQRSAYRARSEINSTPWNVSNDPIWTSRSSNRIPESGRAGPSRCLEARAQQHRRATPRGSRRRGDHSLRAHAPRL